MASDFKSRPNERRISVKVFANGKSVDAEPLDWYPGESFEDALERHAVYQKQNFGPALD